MKIVFLLLFPVCLALPPAAAQTPGTTPDWGKLYRRYRMVGSANNYEVIVSEVDCVKLSNGREQAMLWRNDDPKVNSFCVMPSPTHNLIIIAKPQPAFTDTQFLLFQRKRGLEFIQVDEKVVGANFRCLMTHLAAKYLSDDGDIDVPGWSTEAIEDIGPDELLIYFKPKPYLHGLKLFGSVPVLFNPKTGEYHEEWNGVRFADK